MALCLSCDQQPDIALMSGCVTIHVHGSEFEQYEGFTVLSYALLPEEYRAFRSQLNSQSKRRKHGREHGQQHRAPGNIHGPLYHRKQLPLAVALRHIGIQRGSTGRARNLLIPIIWKKVKGNAHLIELLMA